MIPTPIALLLLRQPDSGLLLALASRVDPQEVHLPGGEVRPGETFEEAAARELRRQTGAEVVSTSWLYTDLAQGRPVSVFRALAWKEHLRPINPERVPVWVNEERLRRPGGKAAAFYRRMFSALKERKAAY